MKILHTADWHIGKILHKHPLHDELILFFDWLLITLEQEKIDVLLVSGDVFDLANPSAKDRQLYYSFLKKLVSKNIRIIITGGNHDSIGFLNAPKELLQELNITIIGGATEELEDELIPIKNNQGTIECIIAAVPFLRDKDLRNSLTDELYTNRTEAIREGIKHHYANLRLISKSKYSNVPIIAMGHLYAVGSINSDSERDIHVGNAAAIDSEIFKGKYEYVALGHIHRPQRIGNSDYIRYSGSPIALSFSEKEDKKCVLIIEIENGNIKNPKIIYTPKSRELKKISGTLTEVQEKLEKYNPTYTLPSFVELEIQEEIFSTLTLAAVEDLKQKYNDNTSFKVLKGKTSFAQGTKDTSHLFTEGETIEDLMPVDVFKRKMESENIKEEIQEDIIKIFLELLEQVEQSED